jgi:hypothetical protein
MFTVIYNGKKCAEKRERSDKILQDVLTVDNRMHAATLNVMYRPLPEIHSRCTNILVVLFHFTGLKENGFFFINVKNEKGQ